MKTLRDPDCLLADGLDSIRTEFKIPPGFPAEVSAAATSAATRRPDAHADWTDRAFVTLDPASSTDLDQAFAIEHAGSDMLLHYAIADVGWFVRDGDALDTEAWRRGTTTYLPDGKAGLYPPALSEHAASLLPDGPRPAVVLSVRIAPDGTARLDRATRAMIRSRAKLGYETVRPDQLPPGFDEIGRRIAEAEKERGASRVDPPEQEVNRNSDGGYTLRFRPYSLAETQNAAMSLAANLAVADLMLKAETGLFRVMLPPDQRDEDKLRRTAQAFGIDWPGAMPLSQLEKRLNPADPHDAALMMAIRRAGSGASYRPFVPGELPWHSAIAAPYAHCTAPLRRLADRYVLRAVLALANDENVPGEVTDAFLRLPRAMARAAAREGQVERAVINLAEVAMLSSRVGETFAAIVTQIDEDRARIQLCDFPVVESIPADQLRPGQRLDVRLTAADNAARKLSLSPQP